MFRIENSSGLDSIQSLEDELVKQVIKYCIFMTDCDKYKKINNIHLFKFGNVFF